MNHLNKICVISRRVRIPKSFITKQTVENDLVLKDTRFPDFGTRSDMKCYQELKDNFLVPKPYGIRYIKENNLPSNTIIPKGDNVSITFKGELRRAQIPVVDDAMKSMLEKEGAVLNLFCGFGKTTCANMISCKLGVKTLILVHTSALAEQWKDRIEQFVEGSSVGMIKQSVFDIEDKTHVIGLMQSISMRDYGHGAFNSFGLMIVDECHHVCAETLSKCITVAGTRYRLGLSATPFRKDGFHPFLWFSIGDIASTVERSNDSQELLVEAVLITEGPSVIHTVYRKGGKKSVNMSRMISDLCDAPGSENRTKTLAQCIKNKYQEGRHIIVLSGRRDHLVSISEELDSIGVHDIGFMVGGQKSSKTKEAELSKVVLATYAFTSEGVDIPSLDTAIFATPRSDVVQTTGRILRSHPNKKTPLVVDFVDYPYVFSNQFKKRIRYYKTLGGEVSYLDDEFKETNWGSKPKKKKEVIKETFGFNVDKIG